MAAMLDFRYNVGMLLIFINIRCAALQLLVLTKVCHLLMSALRLQLDNEIITMYWHLRPPDAMPLLT